MPVLLDPVPSDAKLPAKADVVIIGGGIIGVCTAYELADKGIPVLLCEKGRIGAEQSSRNWGWCRTMGRDLREMPLAQASLKLWRDMDARIGAETGFRQTGTLYICPDDKTLAKREAWLDRAKAYGVSSRILRAPQVNETLQGSVAQWSGALFTPDDGVAEPSLAAPAIALAARRKGARIFTDCAVRSVELSAGRVSGVVTEKGTVACTTVVLAGGVWSSLFCRSLGLRLPQLKVLASVLRTAPTDQGPGPAAWGPGLSLRKRRDGGYTVSHGSVIADIVPDSFRFFREFLPLLKMEWSGISLHAGRSFFDEAVYGRYWTRDGPSPFERVRELDPLPSQHDLARARQNLEKTFPVFKTVRTEASWGGMIDATPDILPVISRVESVPGLILSTGYSGHGFGIGPGAGSLTAQLVTGESPIADPAPFRFARFTDGSSIRPETGL
ncbi:NAD(P)/FAD-dependent oxidoreductase [Taklimakanibacter deserti]|uniref:NAD(P)/FAD-dependent oxidoreductase n=1 Tax=Taklimakanibacter deserti TaxID=2267839 RepID=UPI000E650F90